MHYSQKSQAKTLILLNYFISFSLVTSFVLILLTIILQCNYLHKILFFRKLHSNTLWGIICTSISIGMTLLLARIHSFLPSISCHKNRCGGGELPFWVLFLGGTEHLKSCQICFDFQLGHSNVPAKIYIFLKVTLKLSNKHVFNII